MHAVLHLPSVEFSNVFEYQTNDVNVEAVSMYAASTHRYGRSLKQPQPCVAQYLGRNRFAVRSNTQPSSFLAEASTAGCGKDYALV
jgi:hypothetical protein